MIIAGLLHDTVEDTYVSIADIKADFEKMSLRLLTA